jgi:hypothetical protein
MRTFVRQNSLSLFFAVIFLAALIGQAFAGHADYNAQQVTEGLATVSLGRYLTSSSFAVDVAENWQSEYLQFLLYILATVWFLQRGSPESKSLDQAGTESDEKQKTGQFADENSPAMARGNGPVTTLYSWSLGLVMGAVFFASWGHPVARRTGRLQRGATRSTAGPGVLAGIRHLGRLLEPHVAELAVGIPGGRFDGGALDLPSPAWITRVQAGGLGAHLDRRRGLTELVGCYSSRRCGGSIPSSRSTWSTKLPLALV